MSVFITDDDIQNLVSGIDILSLLLLIMDLLPYGTDGIGELLGDWNKNERQRTNRNKLYYK